MHNTQKMANRPTRDKKCSIVITTRFFFDELYKSFQNSGYLQNIQANTGYKIMKDLSVFLIRYYHYYNSG